MCNRPAASVAWTGRAVIVRGLALLRRPPMIEQRDVCPQCACTYRDFDTEFESSRPSQTGCPGEFSAPPPSAFLAAATVSANAPDVGVM